MVYPKETLRLATWNVLADAYLEYGDYNATSKLMRPGARLRPVAALIARLASEPLNADIIALQEVEEPLKNSLVATTLWQPFWSQKQNAPDGCLTLVRKDVEVSGFEAHHFGDGSGHVMQLLRVGGIAIVNSHLTWTMPNRTLQAKELLNQVSSTPRAVLLGDYNDRPGEPVRQLLAQAGFVNIVGDEPTAYIANREGPASLDILAVRGLAATRIPVELGEDFALSETPSKRCPSDHIPVLGILGPSQQALNSV